MRTDDAQQAAVGTSYGSGDVDQPLPERRAIFVAGDDLVFQLESGYGLIRVLAVEGRGSETIWHLLVYDEFFPDVERAEAALVRDDRLPVRVAHTALTDYALEKTPAARLGNRPVTKDELEAYRRWLDRSDKQISDRSILMTLGLR